jgi:hypothetical protein
MEYARRIQLSLLPDGGLIKKIFKDAFKSSF